MINTLTWSKITQGSQVQLDIVGIVAILGEASTARNAQASALGWHHILPRLLPAPQALLKHEQNKRLPRVDGTVVGAYNGNALFELNWFCQLLHNGELDKNEVQYVVVERNYEARDTTIFHKLSRLLRKDPAAPEPAKSREENADSKTKEERKEPRAPKRREQAYGVKAFGPLAFLSVLGFCMSIGLLTTAIHYQDGPALLSVACLSATSSVVGFASWWRLDCRELVKPTVHQEHRKTDIPDSDVVIYYPREGAFRVVHCTDESISRLYFRTESCDYVVGDNWYRGLALVSSIFLMAGLLSMGNAGLPMQLSFAACYVVLNALYWSLSAINPTSRRGHWTHNYSIRTFEVRSPEKSSQVDAPVNITAANEEQTSASSTLRRRFTFHEQDKSSGRTETSGSGSRDLPSRSDVLGQRPQTDQQNDSIPHHKHHAADKTIKFLHDEKDKVASWLNDKNLINRREHKRLRDNVPKEDTFTTALWKAIALTGTSQWARHTHIAPNNKVWTRWLDEAEKRARDGVDFEAQIKQGIGSVVETPRWDYQESLMQMFKAEAALEKRRPPEAHKLPETVNELSQMARVVRQMRQAGERAKTRSGRKHSRVHFSLRPPALGHPIHPAQQVSEVSRAKTYPG